jgi:hypothetical protein
MFSPRRVEPDPFLQLLEQNMAAPTPPHLLSCYHGAQENAGGCHDWQPWQDGHMQASVLPVHAYRNSKADTAPYNAASLVDVQHNLNMSAAFNAGSSGLDGHVNGFHHLFGSSDTMMPQTDPTVILEDQFREWNWASSTASFPTTLANSPLMLDLSGHSTLDQTAMTGLGGFDSLTNIGMRNAELSGPASDQLSLAHAGYHPFSC